MCTGPDEIDPSVLSAARALPPKLPRSKACEQAALLHWNPISQLPRLFWGKFGVAPEVPLVLLIVVGRIPPDPECSRTGSDPSQIPIGVLLVPVPQFLVNSTIVRTEFLPGDARVVQPCVIEDAIVGATDRTSESGFACRPLRQLFGKSNEAIPNSRTHSHSTWMHSNDPNSHTLSNHHASSSDESACIASS